MSSLFEEESPDFGNEIVFGFVYPLNLQGRFQNTTQHLEAGKGFDDRVDKTRNLNPNQFGKGILPR